MNNIFEYTEQRIGIIDEEIGRCESEERKRNLEVIKNNILTFMRKDFKIVNSRDVKCLGFDDLHHICVIVGNHWHSGRSVYYYNISQEEFDELMLSDNTVDDVERIFKDKSFKIL